MSEPEFACYGPYCANYLDAITIVNEQMPNLLVSLLHELALICSVVKNYLQTTSPVFILNVNSRHS
jgi:hypothetical protein